VVQVLVLVVLVVLILVVVQVVQLQAVQVDWVTLVDRPLAGVLVQQEEQLVLQEVQLQEGGQLPQEVQLQRALSVLPEPPQREEKGEEGSTETETTCTEAITTIMSIALSLEDGLGRTLTTVMVTSGSSCVRVRPGLGLLLVTQTALGLSPESVHQRVVILKKRKKLVELMNALKDMKVIPLLV